MPIGAPPPCRRTWGQRRRKIASWFFQQKVEENGSDQDDNAVAGKDATPAECQEQLVRELRKHRGYDGGKGGNTAHGFAAVLGEQRSHNLAIADRNRTKNTHQGVEQIEEPKAGCLTGQCKAEQAQQAGSGQTTGRTPRRSMRRPTMGNASAPAHMTAEVE